MSPKTPEPTVRPRERAFLVGVEWRREDDLLSLEDSLTELTLLSETAGLDVVGEATQRFDSPNPKTFIGPGKVDEVKALVEDDGRGFDAEAALANDDHHPSDPRVQSIVTLKEKYELVGGSVSVTSGETEGTVVRLELPSEDNVF